MHPQQTADENLEGVLLTDFCASKDFVISNTYLEHHPRRLYTWTGTVDRVRNQIDDILIKHHWRTSMMNAKTRPKVDCGCDQQLLTARVRIKLKVNTKKSAVII